MQCPESANGSWDPAVIKGLTPQFCNGFDANKDKKQTYSDDGTRLCTSQVNMEFKQGLRGSCSRSCEDTLVT